MPLERRFIIAPSSVVANYIAFYSPLTGGETPLELVLAEPSPPSAVYYPFKFLEFDSKSDATMPEAYLLAACVSSSDSSSEASRSITNFLECCI